MMIKDNKLDPHCPHSKKKLLRKEKGLMYIWHINKCSLCGGEWAQNSEINPDFGISSLSNKNREKLK